MVGERGHRRRRPRGTRFCSSHRRRPRTVDRTVLLDGVSRTSRILARLLLTEGPLAARVRQDLEVVEVGPDEATAGASGDVAALVIGDAARVLDDRFTVRIDLADEWHRWTGLPFVFAVWAGRPEVPADVVEHLMTAGQAGVAAVPQSYAGEDLRYLTENLRYALDDRALMGLRRFGALARAAGLLDHEDVELYGPPEPRRARPAVRDVLAKALDGQRLNREEARSLLAHASLADLGATAHEVRLQRHPGREVRYMVGGLAGEPLLEGPGIFPIEVGGATDVVEQLLALRSRQDRDGTVLGARIWASEAAGAYGSHANTAVDHQRAVALARLVLDNVEHLHASPSTEGLGMAQASLRLGCNHYGTVTMHGDPEGWPAQVEAVERHIREAGYEPVSQQLPLPSLPNPSADAAVS